MAMSSFPRRLAPYIPFGKEGSGGIGKLYVYNAMLMPAIVPIVVDALGRVPFKSEKQAFTMVDYGAADGGSSMPLWREAITWLKQKYGERQEVHVIYEDQPWNDFKSLFMRLHGSIANPPSYLGDFKDVFATVCGTNFYEQCLPRNTVHLALTLSSVHWLSTRLPCISDSFHHLGSANKKETQPYKKQFRRDWEKFLLLRSKELVPGGQLVVSALHVNQDGESVGHSNTIKEGYVSCLDRFWRELRDEERISVQEYQNATMQAYNATREEYEAPFETSTGVVSQSGLRLLSTQDIKIPCWYNNRWRNAAISPEQVREEAKSFVLLIRTFSNQTFDAALSRARPEVERLAILDRLYQKYVEAIVSSPADMGLDMVTLLLHIEKVAN